jgi:hypothetical protein
MVLVEYPAAANFGLSNRIAKFFYESRGGVHTNGTIVYTMGIFDWKKGA